MGSIKDSGEYIVSADDKDFRGVIFSPGDTMVFTVDDDYTPEDLEHITNTLKAALGGLVEVLVVAGGARLHKVLPYTGGGDE